MKTKSLKPKAALTSLKLERKPTYVFAELLIHILANAEVPAKDIAEDARAASRRDPCQVLQRIANIKANSADKPLYKIFRQSGLTLGIHFSTAQVGDLESYPYVARLP